VREERVEVWFGAEVENLGVVRVVDVREDAQELAVDVFDCGGERLGEVVAFSVNESMREICFKLRDKSWIYVPDFVGKVPSSSKRFWTHVMT
jgi:hypothetical protein